MEKGEFFKDDKELETLLMRLKPDTMLHFDGSKIHLLGPFNAQPSLKEIFPEHNITFSSFEWHNSHLFEEYLRLGTIEKTADLPLGEAEEEIFIPEEVLSEWDAIADQENLPFAVDVSYLIQERKEQGETFAMDLREYASMLLEERGELDKDALTHCDSCETVPNPRDYPCNHCDGSGFIPEHPTLTLTNLDTNTTEITLIDPLEWLASGELPIRWQDRDEAGSIRREGFVVDLNSLLTRKLAELGIDPKHAVEIYNREYPHIFTHRFEGNTFLIDENMFVPDALAFIRNRIANHIRHITGYSQSITMRAKRTSLQLMSELQSSARQHGYDLGYTHKVSRDTDWEPRHAFLLISHDGRRIGDILPDGLLRYLDEVNHAMEHALEWMSDPRFSTEPIDL